MKLVSIIVPVYNLERYIEKTLQSLVNQSYRNIEIVLVDDGSKDNSVQVINNFFENKHIPYKLISINNSGVSKARNVGLDAAKGDYVILLDGDDSLKEDAVEKLINKAEQNNADICHTGYIEVKEDDGRVSYSYSSDKIYIEGSLSGIKALQMKLRKEMWICTGNALYKREMLQKYNIRYSENLAHGEDIEFINKCIFHAEKVVSVKEELLHILIRKSSASSSKFSYKYLDALKTNRQLYDYIKNYEAQSIEEDKKNLLMLIDYDYINIFLGIAKRIYDEHSLWQQRRANSIFKELKINLSDINLDEVLKNIRNFKIFELKIFLLSKTLYFYFCKLYKILRR